MDLTTDNPLTQSQLDQFQVDGFTILENALTLGTVSQLAAVFHTWVLESRHYKESFGRQRDGRPRFSVEPGHSFSNPVLRRVASPVELSDLYLEVMRNGVAVDAVAQIIGPNIKFNNSKINSKHPGRSSSIEFHQDFMFEPHSNDDLVTVLYFLDELNSDNGPLQIVPGSHRGPLYEHWHEGKFTGSVSREVAEEAREIAVSCCGPPGTAYLMDSRLLHGSAENASSSPRTLYIVEYCAEDAYPLQSNHIPSEFMGEIVRGKPTNRVRCSAYEMEFPEFPKSASFFEQQASDSH